MKLLPKNTITLFGSILFLKLAVSLSFSLLAYHLDIKHNVSQGFSNLEFFILLSVVGPFVETFFFQHALSGILEYFKIEKVETKIVLMSLIFAFFHQYNWLYVISVFFGGILLNHFYLHVKVTKGRAFLLTFLLHSLYNTCLFAIGSFFET